MLRIAQHEHANGRVTLDIDHGTFQTKILFVGPELGMKLEGDDLPARDAATKLLKELAKSINENVPARVNWVGI